MSRTTQVLAVLMLAVTIAATTAASAVVQAAVTTSLGVPDPAGLLNIEPLRELPGRGAVVFNESYPNYLRLRDRKFGAFSEVSCVLQSVVGWDDGGEVRPLQASRVTASFFVVAGVAPLMGQPFAEVHDGPTPAPVAVISHRLWQQAFAGSAQAVGKSIRLAGVPHTVLAVMPANFGIPAPTDVWTPLGNPMAYLQPTSRIFNVFARLRPGESMARAGAMMADFTRFTVTEDGVNNRDFYYRARPLRDALVGSSGPVIWLVQIGAVLLFVLAVSNVWSLFLAMVIERSGETAVRRALGASTRDIIGLLVRRSLAIAVPAGIIGALLAWVLLPMIQQLRPNPALGFLLAGARVDAGVLATLIALTLIATVGIVLLPAWHAVRQAPVTVIGSASRGGTLSRPPRDGFVRSWSRSQPSRSWFCSPPLSVA